MQPIEVSPVFTSPNSHSHLVWIIDFSHLQIQEKQEKRKQKTPHRSKYRMVVWTNTFERTYLDANYVRWVVFVGVDLRRINIGRRISERENKNLHCNRRERNNCGTLSKRKKNIAAISVDSRVYLPIGQVSPFDQNGIRAVVFQLSSANRFFFFYFFSKLNLCKNFVDFNAQTIAYHQMVQVNILTCEKPIQNRIWLTFFLSHHSSFISLSLFFLLSSQKLYWYQIMSHKEYFGAHWN